MSSIVLQNDVKFSEDGEQIIEGQDVDWKSRLRISFGRDPFIGY